VVAIYVVAFGGTCIEININSKRHPQKKRKKISSKKGNLFGEKHHSFFATQQKICIVLL